MNRRSQMKRMTALCALLTLFIGLIGLRLADLQLVNGAAYRQQAERTIVRTYSQPAARGEILDRYGRPLISNSLGFSISFDYFTWDEETQNETILRLCDIAEEAGLEYYDSLPVSAAAPFSYTFSSMEDEEAKKMRAFFEKKREDWKIKIQRPQSPSQKEWRKEKDPMQQSLNGVILAANAGSPKAIVRTLEGTSASQLMNLLREQYKIGDGYTSAQVRRIAGVRYEMEQQEFSSWNNLYIFASQADVDTVALIKERSSLLPGVTITVENVRQYDTVYGAHVLGRIGKIWKEEYEELKGEGYGMNAVLGKDGLEKAYESYLRGKDGKRSVETNSAGDILAEREVEPAQPGANMVLTLDLDLQAAAEESLARNIEEIRRRNQGRRSGGWDAEGGAAVVIEVDTGGILACASYPAYNLSTFSADFQTLMDDPLKPMFNRAVSGAYPPGSTFKPVTALAALESGVVTTQTRIRDAGPYMFYASSGYTPACWIWNDRRGSHGNINISEALKYSCNYYFYEASRLMGIDTLNHYAKQLGLGQKTGVEIPGEVSGTLAGPESREARGGDPWMPGETLQAAIGQSEQQFTPIQMANYMATILNGGTHYQPHLLKQAVSYDYGEIVEDYQPVVLDQIDISPETIDAIKEGMRGVVTDDGTAASIFRNYPIAIGGKTGSAQTTGDRSRSAHGVFISFAPYDDPQIAVFVLVEHGGSGGNVAPIVRDIYDAYFGKQTDPSPVTPENQLIA